MAGKLSVQFELEMPNARMTGEKIGQQVGAGIDEGIRKALGSGSFSAAFLKNNPQLGRGTINIDPYAAPGPRGIAKLLGLPALPELNNFGKGGINWKQLMLSAAVAPFSSWVGARGIAGALGGGASGHGGGGGASSLFGGNFSKFEAAFLAVEVVSRALHKAFEELVESVKRGSELFSKSAALHVSTSSLFQSQELGKALGISQKQAEDLMFRGEWGHARQSLQQFRGRSAIGSLPEVTKDTLMWTKEIGAQWQEIAGELFTVDAATKRLSANFEIFFGEISASIGPSIRSLFNELSDLPWAEFGKDIGELLSPLKFVTYLLSGFVLGLQVLGAALASIMIFINNLLAHIPGAGKLGIQHINYGPEWQKAVQGAMDFSKGPYAKTDGTAQTGRQLPSMSNFEHMGFVIGSHRNSDTQKQIANNTSRMASLLQTIAQHMGANSAGHGIPGGSGVLNNMP